MFKNWFGKNKESLADALEQNQKSAATIVLDEERTEENWIKRLRGGLDKTREPGYPLSEICSLGKLMTRF